MKTIITQIGILFVLMVSVNTLGEIIFDDIGLSIIERPIKFLSVSLVISIVAGYFSAKIIERNKVKKGDK